LRWDIAGSLIFSMMRTTSKFHVYIGVKDGGYCNLYHVSHQLEDVVDYLRVL
jgi:hypothetical protein